MRIRHLNLRSRRGVSEPLSFIVCFPVWWLSIGIVLVLGMWMWSMAINVVALNQSGQAVAVGRDGEAARRSALAAGLGGFVSDYANADYDAVNSRAASVAVDRTVPVRVFSVPSDYTVRQRVLVRQERFYARPSEGGWE